MHRKPEIQELSAADVDQVTGGMIITALAVHLARTATKGGSQGDPPSGGGQNDPAQMFQQILQQLTQG
jgi:hypothetical protein